MSVPVVSKSMQMVDYLNSGAGLDTISQRDIP